MLNLNFVLFRYLNKLAHLGNPLDKQFHTFCNQYSLLHGEQKQFALLYNHPKVPFQAHHKDKLLHIEYIQYKYHKHEHCVT
mmetsp:Transcript_64369/g.176700  ORF Transcript_64369/g.176700 Transcript_64369/m.176700 type:complete len:81 (-) Transcript_64369:49-291(-)